MQYTKQEELKVVCIATKDDFEFFGIAFEDILDRTASGYRFLKKAKELAGKAAKVTWTDSAYTLQISMLPEGNVSLTFSETIPDYIENLKHSMAMADKDTLGPLQDFIQTLEKVDEESARELVRRFEHNVKEKKQ